MDGVKPPSNGQYLPDEKPENPRKRSPSSPGTSSVDSNGHREYVLDVLRVTTSEGDLDVTAQN